MGTLIDRQSRKPHRVLSLQKTTQPALANHSPRGDGVHPTLPTARPARRLYEDPLLWFYESKLIGVRR